MLKNFFDLVRQVFLLNERVTRNQAGLDALRAEFRDLSDTAEESDRYLERKIDKLAFEVKRLGNELRHSREREADARAREADARERLRLELEKRLLRETRQLPPATEKPKKDDAE